MQKSTAYARKMVDRGGKTRVDVVVAMEIFLAGLEAVLHSSSPRIIDGGLRV